MVRRRVQQSREEAISEAERLLAPRRTSVTTMRPFGSRSIPTARASSLVLSPSASQDHSTGDNGRKHLSYNDRHCKKSSYSSLDGGAAQFLAVVPATAAASRSLTMALAPKRRQSTIATTLRSSMPDVHLRDIKSLLLLQAFEESDQDDDDDRLAEADDNDAEKTERELAQKQHGDISNDACDDQQPLPLLQGQHMIDREEQQDAMKLAYQQRQRTVFQRSLNVKAKMRTLICTTSFGAFLSGYNTGILSGAMLPLQRTLSLTPTQMGLVVSASLLTAYRASIIGATLNRMLGRRFTLLLASIFFFTGGILLSTAWSFWSVVGGQMIVGAGIGLESLTSPIYICEVAKPAIRGRMVGIYAFCLSLGQFLAGIIAGICGKLFHSKENNQGGWRVMFGFALLPAFTMLVGCIDLPESPGWLLVKGKRDEAIQVLNTIRDTRLEVEMEVAEIEGSLLRAGGGMDNVINNGVDAVDYLKEDNKPLWTRLVELFCCAPTRRAFFVGCGLMLLQQLCGPSVALYYSATIYHNAGFQETTAIWLSAFTSLAQLVGLALSVILVESAGRRILVLASLLLVSVSLFGAGFSFYLARIFSPPVDLISVYMDQECESQSSFVWSGSTQYCQDCAQIPDCGYCGRVCVKGNAFGPDGQCPYGSSSEWTYSSCYNPYSWTIVFFLVAFLLAFGIGLAGLPWTLNSEIYPLQHRGLAVSITTAASWFTNLLVSSTFPILSSPAVLTSTGVFWLYSGISAFGFVCMYFALPETKGLSIEEIEKKFSRPGDKHMHDEIGQTVHMEERDSLLS